MPPLQACLLALPRLQWLCLAGNSHVTDELVLRCLDNLRDLRELSLAKCGEVTGAVLAAGLESRPLISTDLCAEFSSGKRNARILKQLDVSRCGKVSVEDLQAARLEAQGRERQLKIVSTAP